MDLVTSYQTPPNTLVLMQKYQNILHTKTNCLSVGYVTHTLSILQYFITHHLLSNTGYTMIYNLTTAFQLLKEHIKKQSPLSSLTFKLWFQIYNLPRSNFLPSGSISFTLNISSKRTPAMPQNYFFSKEKNENTIFAIYNQTLYDKPQVI